MMSPKKRLAIIGCGSSGLISLKYALDELPEWEVIAYEKSSDIVGSWGRPPAGFVSTSTKYTTQFACFAKFDARVSPQAGSGDQKSRSKEFFCDDEYGQYLEEFATHFQLDDHIVRNCEVIKLKREGNQWVLTLTKNGRGHEEVFDAVIICTGLVDQVQPIESEVETLRSLDPRNSIENKTIVVIGGGESGTDMAMRLAKPELNNRVYLSLRNGIRVSPRYHPIRGVPSDFLRNRLLLSFHQGLRNWIGQKFVEFRILSQRILERLFPSKNRRKLEHDDAVVKRRREWDFRLTKASKDRLFNMYHNKSDDFLNLVGEERIKIIGSNIDASFKQFYPFQSDKHFSLEPDLVVPAIGFQSKLDSFFDFSIQLRDFYQGCCHIEYDNLFAVGFTRPIIGSIPPISEMQARLVSRLISGRDQRPFDLGVRHQENRKLLQIRYPKLDTENAYPVEMFPYCDELSKHMNCYPLVKTAGSMGSWIRMQLGPATTMHYFDQHQTLSWKDQPVHSPMIITVLLLILKPLDWVIRLIGGRK